MRVLSLLAIIAGEEIEEDSAVSLAREFQGLNGLDLAKEVTTKPLMIGQRVLGEEKSKY